MPDEIQPALTPEEWRERRIELFDVDGDIGQEDGSAGAKQEAYLTDEGRLAIVPIDDGFYGTTLSAFATAAIVALANAALSDDDPRKITREDVVDELDAYHAAVIFARWCEDNGMPDKRIEAKERAARHRQRAAKLAALLPPNK